MFSNTIIYYHILSYTIIIYLYMYYYILYYHILSMFLHWICDHAPVLPPSAPPGAAGGAGWWETRWEGGTRFQRVEGVEGVKRWWVLTNSLFGMALYPNWLHNVSFCWPVPWLFCLIWFSPNPSKICCLSKSLLLIFTYPSWSSESLVCAKHWVLARWPTPHEAREWPNPCITDRFLST